MNLLTIFLTGLFTGGLTCLAVQGGLLASTIAQREQNKLAGEVKKNRNALPILSFLVAKLVAYAIFGFILGWLGSLFQLSLQARVILQFAVVVFMVGTALNLLNVHPIFRYFVLTPPRFLTRLVRRQSKSQDVFAPALLGAFTVFIPCGTTQAMMALAIASGSPFLGAAILFTFVLGTSPLFFVLGYLATRLGEALQQKFMKVAALALILLAVYNFDGAIALTGSPLTLSNIAKNVTCGFCATSILSAADENTSSPVSETTVNILASGYNPNSFTVRAGSSVKLNLVNKGGGGCTQSFTIPTLRIQEVVPLGKSKTIAFKVPDQPGNLPFMCGMGMFRGNMTII